MSLSEMQSFITNCLLPAINRQGKEGWYILAPSLHRLLLPSQSWQYKLLDNAQDP